MKPLAKKAMNRSPRATTDADRLKTPVKELQNCHVAARCFGRINIDGVIARGTFDSKCRHTDAELCTRIVPATKDSPNSVRCECPRYSCLSDVSLGRSSSLNSVVSTILIAVVKLKLCFYSAARDAFEHAPG